MTDRNAEALEALDLIADEILHGEGDVCQQILIAYLVTIRDALAAPTEQQEFTDRKAALEALNRITSNLRWIDSHEYLGDIDLVRAALAAPTDAALHQAHDEIRALRSRLAPTDAEAPDGEREECAQWCDGIRNDPNAPDYLRDGMSQAARLLRSAPPAAVPQGWIPVSERLPKPTDRVLACDAADGHMQILTGKFIAEEANAIEWPITHWIQLPAAPSPTGEE